MVAECDGVFVIKLWQRVTFMKRIAENHCGLFQIGAQREGDGFHLCHVVDDDRVCAIGINGRVSSLTGTSQVAESVVMTVMKLAVSMCRALPEQSSSSAHDVTPVNTQTPIIINMNGKIFLMLYSLLNLILISFLAVA